MQMGLGAHPCPSHLRSLYTAVLRRRQRAGHALTQPLAPLPYGILPRHRVLELVYMGNVLIRATVPGAWVGKCPACGTCCYFPKLPATDYAGQRVVRPHNSDLVSVRCVCGRRFQTDSEGLTFVTVATLSIRRLSSDAFAIAQNYAGTETDLGSMSETELRAYLNSRTLIDIIPSQVLTFLGWCKALDMDVVFSVVCPPVADSIAAA